MKALGLGLLSLSLVFVLAACAGVASPQGWASPVITDNTLLASPNHRELVAVDVDANTREWQFPPEDSDISLNALYATPAVSQGTVFVGGYNGTLYALSESDGSEKWSRKTGGHIVGGPAVSGNGVYVGSADGCLYAFDTRSGAPLFDAVCTDAKIWSTPVVEDGVVYFGSMDKRVYAIDAASGESKWSQAFKANGAFASTLVIDSGTLYIGALDEYMYALDASNGEMRWRFKADDWIWNRALVSGGSVYFGSIDGRVYGLDASNGELRWEKPFEGEGVVRGGVALVDSTLVVATDKGNVYGIDAANGEQVWSEVTSSGVLSDLVVSDGMVYYSTKKGDVERVDPERGSISTVTVPE